MKEIPIFLKELLEKQYLEHEVQKIIHGYSSKRKVTFRINRLKTTKEKVKKVLTEKQISFTEVPWYEDAFIMKEKDESCIKALSIYENGEIYLQSLSSMIPVLVLEPKNGEHILDMAAAPGSKTTQISSLTLNQSLITACEKNKIRADRLQYNIKKQGVTNITILNEDARKLDEFFTFDKILLDAPCSGSGTILLSNEKSRSSFSKELLERSQKTQLELIRKAVSLLKKDHEMVYSTCSILKEENEDIINQILKEGHVEIVPIEILNDQLPLLKGTIEGTLTISPTEDFEGFFVAKLRKK